MQPLNRIDQTTLVQERDVNQDVTENESDSTNHDQDPLLLGGEVYRTLIETSPDAIILVAPDGTILLGNSQAVALHGFNNTQELVGANVFGLIAHEEHQRAMQHLGSATELGSIKNIEHRLLRSDGTSFPAELSISVIVDEDSKPKAFIGIVRDISERKKAQDNIKGLLEEVQRYNEELALAYDSTLEGWTAALDLRDKETEGHSRRVTDLSVRLARQMGISEDELENVRRGALLHDIGKMGIPDAILLKPGPLTDEEWQIMRMHPQYANELLSPIPFLRSTLDIPYYHHEKWDGSGYPMGLKGTEIPLTARIFAVIDVWDALRSDRPYRAAWSEAKVYDYLQAESGKHFDPDVVKAFMEMDLSPSPYVQHTGPLEVMLEKIEYAQSKTK